MATYELTKKGYDALMARLNPDAVYPTYAAVDDAYAHQDLSGSYSQTYICRGENSTEARENAHLAVGSGGKKGNPVATAKIYQTEFGTTTKIVITTDDKSVMGALGEMGKKPKQKKDYSGFTDNLVAMLHEAARDGEFREYLHRNPESRSEMEGSFREAAQSLNLGLQSKKGKKQKSR